MYILGISAFYHDSAAVLIKNGKVICAIEEERFTRIKHDNSFPTYAVKWCLNEEKISIADINTISYYEKPLLKFERTLDMFIQTWPKSLASFVHNMPELIGRKLSIEHTIRDALKYKGKVVYVPHHLSHASAAFYSSGFKESAIFTIDGVGEYQTVGLYKAINNSITPISSIDFPHSIGLLYSTFAAFLGFKVNEDEYKLMGLAAYGKPTYCSKIKKIIDIKNDGSFALNMGCFSFREKDKMWSSNFERLFGKPRHPTEQILKKHADIAKSIQKIAEDIYIKMLVHLYSLTQCETVCIGGGVALNALANGLIHLHTPFKNVHILGVSGDSGAALGSALYTYHSLVPHNGLKSRIITLALGSHYSEGEVESACKKYKLKYKKLSEMDLVRSAAQALYEGRIIGWFQGRCEMGPRALGNRSILCRPSPRSMKTKVNNIKIREQFRPFAGSILQDRVYEYFDVPENAFSAPFMNYCFFVKKEKRKELAAIVHADNTCRIQTVSKDAGVYFELINEFQRLSGIPCILNTSFNLKGEPIVENPEQAVNDFMKTKIDVLYIGQYVVRK